MIYQFSRASRDALKTCHYDLKKLFLEVINHYDCSVLEGFRGKTAQNLAFNRGFSNNKWPDSKHNIKPSLAVDVVPYPIDWLDFKRFYYFGGLVLGLANKLHINVVWGGDWDKDNDFNDQKLNDLAHFELRESKKDV